MTLLVLDIGCGENKLKLPDTTVVSVDCRKEVNPDTVCDIRKLPIDSNVYDMVYASHVLEHFGRNEIHIVLDEWARVLKPSGKLKIIVPNLEWAAERILKDMDDEDTTLSVLYGDQTYPENFHFMGFTPKTLMRELKIVGLKNITHEIDGFNLSMEGVK